MERIPGGKVLGRWGPQDETFRFQDWTNRHDTLPLRRNEKAPPFGRGSI